MLQISRLRQKAIFPVALAFTFLPAIPANSEPIRIGTSSNVNTIQGQSGGKINSRVCGFISSQPNQVIEVTERIDYMRVAVSTKGGQPTLLIKGPNGNLCSMKPSPEIAGVWVPGRYSIYVGQRSANSQHNFTLSISQKR